MTKVAVVQFTSGETTPEVDARPDLEKYIGGCRQSDNMISDQWGNSTKRPGTTIKAISNNDGTYTSLNPVYDYPQLQDILESYVTDRLDNIFTDIVVADPQGTTAVTNSTELLAMAMNGSYYMANDITIAGNHTALGSQTDEFNGTLDGRGYKITYTLDDGGQREGGSGLFAEIEDGALIQNLLIDATMTATGNHTGILAGNIVATGGASPVNIKNVHVTGTINIVNTFAEGVGGNKEAPNEVGSLAGGYLTVTGSELNCTDCTATVDITLVQAEDGPERWGGFISSISASLDPNIATFTNCHYRGTIDATGANNEWSNYHGGFVGQTSGTDFIKCSANATLISDASRDGGFVGEEENESTYTKCFSLGSVTSNNLAGTDRSGGFIGGTPNSDVTFTDCYTKATVTASGSALGVGGFAGEARDDFVNCYAIGLLTITDPADSGGFADSQFQSTMTSCFWDTETTGLATSAGDATGKTTAQMKTQATYTNWDFDDIWVMPTT